MLTATRRPCSADNRLEIERSAFNAAFYELGLRWFWDHDTYQALSTDPCARARVRRYVEREQPHLLRAYDADFLAEAVVTAQERCQRAFAACAAQAVPRFNWADPQRGEVGI